MDFHSLVATNLHRHRHPTRMDAPAEERYYSDHLTIHRPRVGPLVSVATAVGLILLLTSIAQT